MKKWLGKISNEVKKWLGKISNEIAEGLLTPREAKYVHWASCLWLLVPIAGIVFFVFGPISRRQEEDWERLNEREQIWREKRKRI